MNKKFKTTFTQQLLVSSSAWIKYGILLVIYLYVYGFRIAPYYIYIFIFFFTIDLLPAIILHIQYYIQNRNAILIIDKSAQTISYHTSTTSTTFNFNEITCFNYVVSYGGGKSAAGYYSFGDYRFCQIGFKNGKTIIITCLMVHDIQNSLEMLLSIKATKKQKIFPFISVRFSHLAVNM